MSLTLPNSHANLPRLAISKRASLSVLCTSIAALAALLLQRFARPKGTFLSHAVPWMHDHAQYVWTITMEHAGWGFLVPLLFWSWCAGRLAGRAGASVHLVCLFVAVCAAMPSMHTEADWELSSALFLNDSARTEKLRECMPQAHGDPDALIQCMSNQARHELIQLRAHTAGTAASLASIFGIHLWMWRRKAGRGEQPGASVEGGVAPAKG
jgi:hypothetical protein